MSDSGNAKMSKAERERWRIGRALLLFVLALGVLTMPRLAYAGDPFTWQKTAIHLWHTGQLDVPQDLAFEAGERGMFFYQNPRNGRWYNKYGIFNTMVSVPIIVAEEAIAGHFQHKRVRTDLLNLQNLILSLFIAGLFYSIANLFTSSPRWSAGWVLASLYASFVWNYLRGQTQEIWQILFAALFIWAVLRAGRHNWCGGWLRLAHLALLLLVLIKTVFILWGAVMVLGWLVWRTGRLRRDDVSPATVKGIKSLSWSQLWFLAGPFLLDVIIIAYLNYLRFGGIFESGYTQWTKEANFFSGNISTGIWGFLTSPDKSVFIYQPLLIVALFGWLAFARRWRWESAIIWGCFLSIFLVSSQVTNWGGHWSYGPRYLVTVLPWLTLPALPVMEKLWSERRRWSSRCILTAIGLLLALSCYLQCVINSLEFMTYYEVREVIYGHHGSPALVQSWGAPPMWWANLRLQWWHRYGITFPMIELAAREMDAQRFERFRMDVLKKVRGNYMLMDYRW